MDIQTLSLGQSPQPEPRAGDAVRKPAVQSPVQTVPQTLQKSEPSSQQLQQALQTINRKLANSTALEFSFHEGTKQTVVRITDKESGEVIRQIPSDAALAIAESIGDYQKGLLLRQEA